MKQGNHCPQLGENIIMGQGYWILIADGYGQGLNLTNPRMLEDKKGKNWFHTNDTFTDYDIIKFHDLDQYEFYMILR